MAVARASDRPSFAINLVRKLSQRRSLVGNPVVFARQSFAAATFERLIGFVCGRVREDQQHEDEHTPRWGGVGSIPSRAGGDAAARSWSHRNAMT
jgi:hypothetical protein